jgi:RNA-directed DNA polymerase
MSELSVEIRGRDVVVTCRYHHLPGWWPTDGATRLFDPMTVPVTRYRYRAANIPTPWQRPSTDPS